MFRPFSRPKLPQNSDDAGFTLLELSIVLVIIGLIVGGVLVGRGLIEAAAVRAQVGQFEQLNTAVFAFKDKYNCIPGDCYNATSFLTFPSGTGANGDGNGYLQTPADTQFPYTMGQESLSFMSTLNLTGLYTPAPLWNTGITPGYVGKDILRARIGGEASGLIATSISGRNGYYLGVHNEEALVSSATHLIRYSRHGLITPAQAYNIDLKMDNSLAQTGKIYAVQTSTDTLTKPESSMYGTLSACESATNSNAYNLTNTNQDCRLFVIGGW